VKLTVADWFTFTRLPLVKVNKFLFAPEPVNDELIKDVTEEYDITTIVITHDMNSVLGIGENILFLYKGNMWWKGNKNEVLTTDNKEMLDYETQEDFNKEVYYVIDNDFNQKNYPDLVGKTFDTPPSYAQVKVIKQDKIVVQERIVREAAVIDKNCKVPPEAISILNEAAKSTKATVTVEPLKKDEKQ
jgi:ABC-type glutathione transport system ATPase component